MDKKYCANCHNTRGGDFCYMCGTKLIEREKCDCGEVLHPIDQYCPACGKKVVKEAV